MNIQKLSPKPEEINVRAIAADNQRHAAGRIVFKNVLLGRQNTKKPLFLCLFIDI